MKNQSVRKPDIRVQKTYDKLFNCFFELLKEKSYENITVLEICEKSAVHRATFYKHFIDKQDFVNFFFTRKLEELHIGDNDEFFLESPTKNSYIEMCNKIVNFIYDNRQIIVDRNLSSNSGVFTDALESAISDMIEKKLSKVPQGILLSPAVMLSHYYAGAIVSMLKWWMVENNQYSKENIMKFIISRFNEIEFWYKHNKNNNQTV